MGKILKMPDSETKTGKKNSKSILIIIILIILIAGVVVIRNVFTQSGDLADLSANSKTNLAQKEIPINSLNKNYFTSYKNSFIGVNADAISFYQPSGEVESSLAINMSDPIVSVNGSYIVIASRGGKDVNLFHDKKLIYKTTLDQNIMNIAVNKKGDFAVVTQDDYYKNRLSLHNSSGEELFAWLSADGYITSVDVSNDGQNIAVGTQNSKNQYYSEFFVFSIYDKTPVFHNKYIGQLLIKSNILDNGDYLALFDNQYKVLNNKGSEQKTYSYPTSYTFKSFDINQNGRIALLFSEEENSHILAADVTDSGAEPANITIPGEISAFCISKNSIFAATNDKICSFGWNGTTNKEIHLNNYNIDKLALISNQALLAVRKTSLSVVPF